MCGLVTAAPYRRILHRLCKRPGRKQRRQQVCKQ